MKLGPGLSFSWKRALGVTKAKRRVSKATGIPLSRGGRRMKLGKWLGMRNEFCLVSKLCSVARIEDFELIMRF
jgi:hypothetical protein